MSDKTEVRKPWAMPAIQWGKRVWQYRVIGVDGPLAETVLRGDIIVDNWHGRGLQQWNIYNLTTMEITNTIDAEFVGEYIPPGGDQ